MIVTTSWDDGDVLDERVADLLDKHGIRGTFYLARSFRPNRLPEKNIRALAKRHEIGAHTLSHPDLTVLSRAAKRNEIEGSKKWLEDITGETVAMFCYPFGRFDADVKTLVAEAGFKGARTARQFVVVPPTDRFELSTTLQVHPALVRRDTAWDLGACLFRSPSGHGHWRPSLGVAAAILRDWPRFAEILFRLSIREVGHIFHLWGHSWEIEATNMWRHLDSFLTFVSSFECCFEINHGIRSDEAALAYKPAQMSGTLR
jgi:peptidoglycan-N-acetylglucosamine deacetylase